MSEKPICPVCETRQYATSHTATVKITIDGKIVYEKYGYYRCHGCRGEWIDMLDDDDDFLARIYKKHTGAKEVIFIFEN